MVDGRSLGTDTDAPRRALRAWRAAALCALAFAVIAGLPGCGNETTVPLSPRAANLPSQEVTDFTLEESDTGRPEWILEAKYAATYSHRGLIVAKDVTIDFFDSDGEKYSRLVAAAVRQMEENEPGPITALVVVGDEGRPLGVLHLHDCIRLGVR